MFIYTCDTHVSPFLMGQGIQHLPPSPRFPRKRGACWRRIVGSGFSVCVEQASEESHCYGIVHILGRPLGSLNIFPYWFYKDP